MLRLIIQSYIEVVKVFLALIIKNMIIQSENEYQDSGFEYVKKSKMVNGKIRGGAQNGQWENEGW